ncbi:hypothetical protein D3C73_1491480 [compost metagenome]
MQLVEPFNQLMDVLQRRFEQQFFTYILVKGLYTKADPRHLMLHIQGQPVLIKQ